MDNAGKLDQGKAMFRLIVESAPSALIMVDAAGTITLTNSQAESLFGYLRDELLGQPVEMLLPERYRARHPDQRGGFFTKPGRRPMGGGRDLYGLRKDGEEVPVEIGLTPIETPQGPQVIAALIDISERRRLERQRHESEQRYAELVEQAADGIMVRQPGGRIVFVNDAACRLLGYSRDELLGMSLLQLTDADDVATQELVRDLKPLETRHFERRLRHRSGHWIPVETSAHRLSNNDIQNIFHDISERLLAQEILRVLPKQLLAAQEAERRRIARELHDEVGSALTAAQIRLGQLGAELQSSPAVPAIAEVSAMLASLLQQVRQMSLELRPSVLDDLGLAAAMRWFVRERVPRDQVEVELDAPLNLPRTSLAVETALFRVFQSAVMNVLRHADARTVRVTLHADARQLHLEITDDGRGFDVSAARLKASQGGSLGILGIEEWIGLSGGAVAIDSKLGVGTRLRATVPIQANEGSSDLD